MVRIEKLSWLDFDEMDQEKKVSTLLTVLLILLFYILLRILNVPKPQFQKEKYDEIDWTQFRPQPQKVFLLDESGAWNEAENISSISEGIKKLDLSDVADNLSFWTRGACEPGPSESPSHKSILNSEPSKIELQTASSFFWPTSLTNPDGGKFKIPPQRGFEKAPDFNISIEESNRRQPSPKIDYGGGPKYCEVLPDKPDANDRTIKLIELIEKPTDSEIDTVIPSIYVDLKQWMKENYTPLPAVVKRFMGYDTLDLTSRVEFRTRDRIFELFLICKQNIYEVRICLIEGNHSTLLIDRGFTKKSHYLRVGYVNKLDRDTILSFGTTQEAPSDQRTKEFYQLFLSWWKSIENNKEAKG